MAKKTSRKTIRGKPGQAEGLPEEKRTGKFNLTKREKAWTIERPDGSFFYGIDACYETITKLYLLCMRTLDEQCQKQGETVEAFIDRLVKRGRTILKNDPFRDPRHSIYYLLLKKTENAVRRKYHLRKVRDTFFYDRPNVTLERFLGEPFHKILEEKSDTIPPVDDALNTQLNKTFNNRWLDLYFDIEESVTPDNWKEKVLLINTLPLPASTAGSADKAFFKASKFFVSYDPAVAVDFYLKYLHANAAEAKNGSLQRLKQTYGRFFTTKKQLDTFERIANKLLLTGDINAALTEAPFIFNKKYATVELDEAAIDHVAVRHAETVQVLNKLLTEEEQTIPVKEKAVKRAVGGLLNQQQLDLLQLFHNNKFTLSNQAVNAYAKSTGFLKNQLIESINEGCYTILGDVLIEETDEGYEILEKYYHKIIAP